MRKELIVVIVNKHKDGVVMKAATAAGATGGTIIHGRGTGFLKKKFFGIDIEPEKEIVLIIANVDIVENICLAINRELNLEKPNQGILFTIDLNKVIGIKD